MPKNLSRTAAYIENVIETAKQAKQKAICFVTGVPGSGKTLAGLNIANTRIRRHEDEHAVFLSGNGPLVAVLREALAVDEVARSRSTDAIGKREAKRRASAFIQNIHHFRDEYLQTPTVPVERVVVFDEAQRAWSREQTSRFMREKRGRAGFDQSEPEFLLAVMDRHLDWCVVVCLVGGGQEINTGEAGLQEWLSALNARFPKWTVHISDKLPGSADLEDAPAYLGNSTQAPALHLGVSIRSFRAELVSEFVAAVISGDAGTARKFMGRLPKYPIALTRNLEYARQWLRNQARGSERIGLVASSNALRLKPIGIHVRAEIDPEQWFLADREDVRSSFALEDVATEFDIQGLELDWVGVCWDANFRRVDNAWQHFNFRGTRWESIRDETRKNYLSNAYRVLMTRARQGMVIVVPKGTDIDTTRPPKFYDETYAFLLNCGLVG